MFCLPLVQRVAGTLARVTGICILAALIAVPASAQDPRGAIPAASSTPRVAPSPAPPSR